MKKRMKGWKKSLVGKTPEDKDETMVESFEGSIPEDILKECKNQVMMEAI